MREKVALNEAAEEPGAGFAIWGLIASPNRRKP